MKWSAEQLKGLRGSKRKWERIVAGTGIDLGAENCPLCKLYIEKNCKGCPVSIATNRMNCDGSPYRLFDTDGEMYEHPVLAKAELMFLKALILVGSK